MGEGRNPKFSWMDALLRADLTPSEFKVGQAICNRWNGDNNLPFASAEWLAEQTGYSVRQVRRALAGLREKGWIAQHSRGGRRGDSTWASRYRMTIPQRDMDVTPNVTSVSSQRDMGVTPVDLSLDLDSRPTPLPEPPLHSADGAPEKQGGEDTHLLAEPHNYETCPWCIDENTCTVFRQSERSN